MRFSFRLAELLNYSPDPKKRPGVIKAICEYTGLDRHQVAVLLRNEAKNIPLDALSRLCDYLVEHGHATADQLPGALFSIEAENFWEMLARRRRLELCLGVRRTDQPDWPEGAWVVASDSVLLGELLNGVSTLGGTAKIRGNLSSQFLSGLLMAAPYARAPVTLRVEGELVSQPYVRMTLEVMQAFSVKVATPGPDTFEVPAPLAYRGRRYAIEPDASAASYFLAAAAIAGGEACVEGLTRESLQGDVAFADVLGQMGCRVWQSDEGLCVSGGQLRGVDVDMNAISDTVQTLAAVALFAEGPTTVRGVHHMRHKETDRLAALATELRKLGAIVEELPAGLVIHPAALHGATLHTYDDHRMAMSLALVGLRQPGVVIRDPGCTAKTYPGFFDDLARLAPGSVRWD